MSYTDSHRAFLQAMLAEPYINVKDGQRIVAAIKTAESKHNLGFFRRDPIMED